MPLSTRARIIASSLAKRGDVVAEAALSGGGSGATHFQDGGSISGEFPGDVILSGDVVLDGDLTVGGDLKFSQISSFLGKSLFLHEPTFGWSVVEGTSIAV